METGRSTRAVMALRDRILAGALPPGERLFEVALAEELGISRTPVRSALAALEQEGLLERQHGGGYAVRCFSFQDVADAIELRGVLEGTAARLAAERGVTSRDLDAMRRLLAALDRAVDPESYDFASYQSLNAEFHEALAALPGSQILRAEISRAGRLPFASASAFLQSQQAVPAFHRSLIAAQAQHHSIVEAIAAREGARAEAVAREHARQARGNLRYVMFKDRSLIDQVPGLSLVVE
ncbi:GntR family transcriptional regulator [Alkalilacustris brevis]|uniref:GntR family transcriptional regulator n=1 Tax=Alkalilacustris brevis TaxID=2026338 RepID=UPI000E0CD8F7|nr:GntR family transcriptional regulator [Alkalilacustris brevis]